MLAAPDQRIPMRHPVVFLAPVLMLLDYYLTLFGSRLADQCYRQHFKVEHYELNPLWQSAVAKRRWLNVRHLILVALLAGILALLAEAVELDATLLNGLLGFIFTVYGLVLGRHLSNILTFAYLGRHPDEIAGEVRLSHRYILSLSTYQQLVAAVPIAMIGIFSPSPFVLGAVAGVLASMLVKTFWLVRARRNRGQQSGVGSSS
jgi:hypothetical protein